jgi:mediator of RNA polymerase II transcription subunit 12
MDTLIFIYDGMSSSAHPSSITTHRLVEIPTDAKSPVIDPFRYYPDTPISSLSQSIPQEYKQQLLTLLTRNPNTSIVADLVHSHRDAQGNVILGGPVANRPWEWAEHLGEPSPEDEDDRNRFQARHLVKNSGSVSLESFAARLTGDSIVRNLVSLEDPRMEDDLRSFEDGLASESVFARDWRETRVVLDVQGVADHIQRMKVEGGGGEDRRPIYGGGRSTQGTPRGSPAPSTLSRSSGRGSSRRHQSPGQASTVYHRMSNSTIGDTIDMDSMSNLGSRMASGSSKRKTAEDDEVEIVEGVVPGKRAKTAKLPPQTANVTTVGKSRSGLRRK